MVCSKNRIHPFPGVFYGGHTITSKFKGNYESELRYLLPRLQHRGQAEQRTTSEGFGRILDEVLKNVMLCKEKGLNIYFQKEGLSIFDDSGKESPFLTIFIAVLGTCAQMERENIQWRLQSGYKNFREKGGKVGRKPGSCKSEETKLIEYREVISLLKRGYSVRNTAKLTGFGISTVQRVKNQFGL